MRKALFLATLVLAGCSSANRAALDVSHTLGTELEAYEKSITDKAAEQRDFYDERAKSIAKSRLEIVTEDLDQLRATRSIEAASELAADPNSARRGWLSRFLLETNAEEKTLDRSLRTAAAEAEKGFGDALRKLELKQKEIDAVQKLVADLAKPPSTKNEAKAVIDFVKETVNKVKEKKP